MTLSSQDCNRRADPHRIKITQEIRNRLHDYKEQTGIGASALLRGKRKDLPQGLNSAVIQNWLNGKIKSARKDHLNYVLSEWGRIAAKGETRIDITKGRIKELLRHRKRTGIGPVALLNISDGRTKAPDGLTPAMIHGWLSGIIKTANQEHFQYALSKWERLPTSSIEYAKGRSRHQIETMKGILHITDDMRAALCDLRDETGIGAQKLLSGNKEKPRGLTPGMINNWLTGGVVTASQEHYEFVLNEWKNLKEGNLFAPLISDEVWQKLSYYKEHGLLPGYIFRDTSDTPEGLSVSMVSAWASRSIARARKEHIDYVLTKCRELEMAQNRRIKITDEMHGALYSCRVNSGIGAKVLFSHLTDVPQGLTPSIISGWINRTVTTARKEHWDFVMKEWGNLHDT